MSGKKLMVQLAPFFCGFIWTGCGGAASTASSPQPAQTQHSAAGTPKPVASARSGEDPQTTVDNPEPARAPSEDESAAKQAPEPTASDDSQREPQAPSDARRPVDVLTGPTVAFMINYAGSAPKETAEQTCREKEPEDLAARAECIQKARADFAADVLVFKKAGPRWAWTIYRRNRSTLLEVSTTQIEFANETANRVVLKVKGDKGQRPLFAGSREIPVTVSSSIIEMDDPKHGHLVYEAKVGLVDSQ